ncbi:hypothetical protein NS220_14575 [Microbacterium testaceum]|uniref:Phosphodiesterase n=1 Tax=Microbacterium testaceum TaxID=2033 RepID=A0A147EU57_MICTE|nr:alkaline phosphatase family protein [Microbacterium testaceum]KTR91309.1 hypothetical protein NS220_14575 [Microbacterium testaceum]
MNAPRKLLLVGIDGLRVDDALRAPAVAPRLAAFAAAGVLLPMTMEVPTISGPGWSSILTGTRIAEHGVVDNLFEGHRLREYRDLLARAVAQRPDCTTLAAADWLPLVDPDGPGPIIAASPERERAGNHVLIARDGETTAYGPLDAEIAAAVRAHLSATGPDVSFVYLGEVDEAGHRHGGIAPEYTAAIVRVDSLLGGILDVVAERATTHDEDWLVAVTTDHGHVDAGGHGGDSALERRSFLALGRFGGHEPLPGGPIAPHEVCDLLLADRGLVP